MGVGVDRVDYTKGILERFLAIERFLEKYSPYQGKFTFVQIGAPSRSHLKRYHDLMDGGGSGSQPHQRAVPDGPMEAHRLSEPAA
jgi:hypothetical protein